MRASIRETNAARSAPLAPRTTGRTAARTAISSSPLLADSRCCGRLCRPTGCLAIRRSRRAPSFQRPTVSRLTYTLTRLGYLTHLARLVKFQLAPALGYAALAHTGIRRVARPFMQQLADDTGGSVALGCRDRLIYIGHCCSDAAVTVHLDLGSRIPNADTAIVRALITALPEAERQDVPLFKPPIASRFDENIRLSSDLANRLSKNQH